MKTNRKWFRTPAVTGIALTAAIGLLAFSGINAARAALNRQSEIYRSEVSLDHIGITLLENDIGVCSRDYATNEVVENGETVRRGSWTESGSRILLHAVPDDPILEKKYEERLQVRNSGEINEYVRVSIYRYWQKPDTDGSPVKDRKLSPGAIQLFKNGKSLDAADVDMGAWIRDTDPGADTAARGGERIVLYYNRPISANAVTETFVDEISVSNQIATAVSQKREGNTITTTYLYDGYRFCLEVTADAVQTHNAEEAAFSAWGRPVSVDGLDGPLSLK